MKKLLLALIVAVSALSFATQAFAQPAEPAKPDQPAQPPRRGAGGPGAPGGFGGPGIFGQQDSLMELVDVLGDLNLAPGFTLTEDQKTKIQAIRDQFKTDREKWRKDHEADLKKIQDAFAEMREAGGRPDRQKMQDLGKQRQDLQATAPKGDEAAKQIKAILTEDQAKKLEGRQTERKAEQERLRKEMQERFGGQGGGPGGGRGDAAGGGGGRRGGAGGGGARGGGAGGAAN